uniref:Uncharacterized protein n=1 Tax=Arundo donax TaxID=35708 RepID=A0A0A9GZW9_ARUDO
MAPLATPKGDCAAPKAIVASIERSPHSAKKTRLKDFQRTSRGLVSFLETFSLTSSSASASSPLSEFPSRFPFALSGSANASFIDLKPKNASRATAAYSPMGNVV